MLDTIISLIPGLIITAIAYLLVPAILCIIGYNTHRSYSLKTIRQITMINGGILWLIFYTIQYNISGETNPSVSAAVIWSFVAYWMMKKILLKKDIELKSDKTENGEKVEFEIVDKNEKKRSFKIPLIIVSILLILSFALNLYQLGIQSNMEDSITQSNNERIKNSEKLDFFDNYVALVVDDGTGWYHKYECYRFSGEDFWAYNIDQAKNLGYEPCPVCCKE
jgi:hypothetical protein